MQTRAWTAVVLAALLSCTAEPIGVPDSGGSDGIRPAALGTGNIISDGRTDGDPDFYFLFPIVPERAPRDRPFDAGAAPTVTICRLENGACAETVADFPYADGAGLGLRTTRQFTRFEFYLATWVTPRRGAGNRYRATVRAYGLDLGYADIQLVRLLRDLRSVPGDVVGVVAGLPLPIPFRIDANLEMVVIQQPTLEEAGSTFSSPVIVGLKTTSGAYNGPEVPVTVSLVGGRGHLGGTTTARTVGGKASFADLRTDSTGFVTLEVTSPGIEAVQLDSLRIFSPSRVLDSTTFHLTVDSQSQAAGKYTFDILKTGAIPAAGTVVIGQQGGGFLRRVVSASVSNNQLTLNTEQATIADLGLVGTFVGAAVPGQPLKASVVKALQAPMSAVRVPLNPLCGLTSVDVDIAPDILWRPEETKLVTNRFGMPTYFTTTVGISLTTSLTAEQTLCETGPGSVGVTFPLPFLAFQPLWIQVGPVPMTLEAGFGGSISLQSTSRSRFSSGVQSTRTFSLTLECSPTVFAANCSDTSNSTSTDTASPVLVMNPQLSPFKFTAALRPSVGIKVAGVLGPRFSVGPYWEWDASPTSSALVVSCAKGWSLDASIALGAFGWNVTYGFPVIARQEGSFCSPSTISLKPAGGWSTLAPMPTSRQAAASVVLNSQLYVVGGYNGSVTTVVESYSPATNSWTSRASTPFGRYAGNGAAAFGGKIYVAGGFASLQVPQKTLYLYDPNTDSWTAGTDMPTAGGCGASGVIGQQVYVFTGCPTSNTFTPALSRYDPGSNTWTSLPPPPNQHEYPAAGVIGSKLYLVGGCTNYGAFDIFDATTGTWSSGPSMPTQRCEAVAQVINGKLYVVGGGVGGAGTPAVNTVEVFDPASSSWTTLDPVPAATARRDAASGVIGGSLYVAGGTPDFSTFLRTLEVFTP